jgi:hypothetical protein
MWYQKVLVSTASGCRRIMTKEMRDLMKAGVQRNLVPLKDYTGPVVKRLKEPYASVVKELKSKINSDKGVLRKLEYKKSLLDAETSTKELMDLDSDIELRLFDIFESKAKIREVKMASLQGKELPPDFMVYG